MIIHLYKQFTPTQENVSSLLKMYNLRLADYKFADSGIENCTILIKASRGRYVLRIYRKHKKGDVAVQRELDFVRYLEANQIPIAYPIANLSGDYLSHLELNGYIWQAILMQHMPGKHADHYSNKLLANLANIQARMHNLAASYQTNNAQKEKLTELRETHFAKLIKNRKTLDVQHQSFIDKTKN